eukprot:CAMPEP_0180664588 /NCGR_PEP_ID=MMETSP1037_2-20121125/60722_1 /TAXON_ID=632150 /ORGANISM="Azadinium spinosum, Strain 3D9" /LENGTH=71 /DNA_ID=CAMNT_0022692761 /DNA_START=87 /DNA_END=298 /DNA_ORIENTATION=-
MGLASYPCTSVATMDTPLKPAASPRKVTWKGPERKARIMTVPAMVPGGGKMVSPVMRTWSGPSRPSNEEQT